jgi:hypothetical protein
MAECPPEKHWLTGEDVVQMDYVFCAPHNHPGAAECSA